MRAPALFQNFYINIFVCQNSNNRIIARYAEFPKFINGKWIFSDIFFNDSAFKNTVVYLRKQAQKEFFVSFRQLNGFQFLIFICFIKNRNYVLRYFEFFGSSFCIWKSLTYSAYKIQRSTFTALYSYFNPYCKTWIKNIPKAFRKNPWHVLLKLMFFIDASSQKSSPVCIVLKITLFSAFGKYICKACECFFIFPALFSFGKKTAVFKISLCKKPRKSRMSYFIRERTDRYISVRSDFICFIFRRAVH